MSKTGFPRIDGTLFVGLVFVICGGIVAWSGYSHAKELWFKASQFFPISLPNDIAERTLVSFPLIFKELISAVSSLCAVLIGVMWFFSGLGEMLRSLNPHSEATDFGHPELVAEIVRTGEAQYWRSSSFLTRSLGKIWGRSRYISPISYEFFGNILRSSVKIMLLAGVIAIVFYFLRVLPLLLQRYFQISVSIAIPMPTPLHFLIGIVLVANLLIMLSLFPIRKTKFARSHETLAVRGRGEPQIFFALLEEGCRLLTHSGAVGRAPIRLVGGNSENIRATLVETHPQSVASISRPGGFLCLPLIFFPLTMGFSRLIHFQRPASEMPYQIFLKAHALDYAIEVLFALGLVMVGLYFAEWARKLFGVRKYRSDIVFCHSVEQSESTIDAARPMDPQGWKWKLRDGVDDAFASWAKDPQAAKSFLLEIFWAEVYSESAGPKSNRYLVRMADHEELSRSMWHILKLPFFVNFEADNTQIQVDRG
jgi:hypothetical protein